MGTSGEVATHPRGVRGATGQENCLLGTSHRSCHWQHVADKGTEHCSVTSCEHDEVIILDGTLSFVRRHAG